MAKLGNITFACSDPASLAKFWAEAIGYQVEDIPPVIREAIEKDGLDPNMASAASNPEGTGPRLFFLKKEKSPVESIPIHLDLGAEDMESEVERLIKLGAVRVEIKTQTIGPYTEIWTVMKDPEGNGFCVH